MDFIILMEDIGKEFLPGKEKAFFEETVRMAGGICVRNIAEIVNELL